MRGNGKGRTSIVWSESSADNYQSAAFRVEAQNFIAFGISFKVQLLCPCLDLMKFISRK